MTADEVYTAINKSCEEKCYAIVYLINNYRMEEAISDILDCFDCSETAAEEVAYRFRDRLGK